MRRVGCIIFLVHAGRKHLNLATFCGVAVLVQKPTHTTLPQGACLGRGGGGGGGGAAQQFGPGTWENL